jgi:hypothetical protein
MKANEVTCFLLIAIFLLLAIIGFALIDGIHTIDRHLGKIDMSIHQIELKMND